MRASVREFVRLEACDQLTHIERWAWWADRDMALLESDPVLFAIDPTAIVESFREVCRGVSELGLCLEDLQAVESAP